jgi:hypothetical protein
MAMPTGSRVPGSQRQSPELVGRRHELQVLSSFLDDVRGGNSRVLVMVGGPGVGKTALFDRLRARATGCRVETSAGVESEMELPFAGLHQLLAPMLGGSSACLRRNVKHFRRPSASTQGPRQTGSLSAWRL